jgi:hypothetical protein
VLIGGLDAPLLEDRRAPSQGTEIEFCGQCRFIFRDFNKVGPYEYVKQEGTGEPKDPAATLKADPLKNSRTDKNQKRTARKKGQSKLNRVLNGVPTGPDVGPCFSFSVANAAWKPRGGQLRTNMRRPRVCFRKTNNLNWKAGKLRLILLAVLVAWNVLGVLASGVADPPWQDDAPYLYTPPDFLDTIARDTERVAQESGEAPDFLPGLDSDHPFTALAQDPGEAPDFLPGLDSDHPFTALAQDPGEAQDGASAFS